MRKREDAVLSISPSGQALLELAGNGNYCLPKTVNSEGLGPLLKLLGVVTSGPALQTELVTPSWQYYRLWLVRVTEAAECDGAVWLDVAQVRDLATQGKLSPLAGFAMARAHDLGLLVQPQVDVEETAIA